MDEKEHYPITCPIVFQTDQQEESHIYYIYDFGYKMVENDKDATVIQYNLIENEGISTISSTVQSFR